MVPGQLSLSELWAKPRADCRPSGRDSCSPTLLLWSADPCGEGEQLQVPRCKHLRGPDMDCTHPNTGQESQAKAVPSATAEKFRVSPAILKTFYSGAIESVLTQCISVWYNNATKPGTASSAESRALSLSASQGLLSPLAGHLPQTLQKAELQKSSGLESPR